MRTTRQLRLSTAGERYIPYCQQALSTLDQGKQNLREGMESIAGELRMTLSSDLGRNVVVPWLDEFMEQHPDIRIKVDISDSNIDFYRDSVDIALRYGSPKEANLYGFKMCDVPLLLCAAKAYVDKHKSPQHPQDLAAHNGIFYQLLDVIYDTWTFVRDDQHYKIKMKGNRSSNDGDLVRRWCVAGKGVAVKSSLDMAADVLADNVITLMPEYHPKSTELWLVCPSRQSITPAVRLLRDHIKDKSLNIIEQLMHRH